MNIPYMEQWVYRRIGKDKGSFGHITRSDVEEIKFAKLSDVLSYVASESRFYRKLFSEHNIDINTIKSYEDLATIPFTSSEDIKADPNRFSCVPLSAIAKTIRLYRSEHTSGTLYSSGTTGLTKRIFFTKEDLATIVDFLGLCTAVATRKGDVVQIMLPERRSLGQAELLARGVRATNCTAIKANPKLNAEEQFQIIKESGTGVIVGIVSYVYRISQILSQKYDLRNTKVHGIVVTSEYVPEIIRERLEEMWGCIVYSHYGMAEMGLFAGIECSERKGVHLNEADYIFEVVDPKTGAPLKHGEEGELVITTLSRKAMPLIRYRTGDITSIISEPCLCGIKNLYRINKITRRTNTFVTIKGGDTIYPNLFDDTIFCIPKVVDYKIILKEENNKDRLTFHVEVVDKKPAIKRAIHDILCVHPLLKSNLERGYISDPQIELVDPGCLKKDRTQKRVIIERQR